MKRITIEISDATHRRCDKARKPKGMMRLSFYNTIFELGLRQLEKEAKKCTK